MVGYGQIWVPKKIIRIIQALYENYIYQMEHQGNLSTT